MESKQIKPITESLSELNAKTDDLQKVVKSSIDELRKSNESNSKLREHLETIKGVANNPNLTPYKKVTLIRHYVSLINFKV